MLTVHHLNNSRSQRILWILEELEVPYEIKCYERDSKTMLAPSSLKKVHPLGKSPVITDGDHTIAESAAIIEYIIDKYGAQNSNDNKGLRPAHGTDDYLQYRYWMHYSEGSAMPPLLLKLVFSELPRQGPRLARPILKAVSTAAGKAFIDREIQTHVDFWESTLTEHSYFVGNTFTAADIQMSFPLEGAASWVIKRTQYPNIFNFLDRLHKRPAFQRAIERGGPYTMPTR